MITLTSGGTLKGKAGTATAVTYTISGDAVTTVDTFQVLGQGQLASSTGDLLSTTPVPSSTAYLIKNILLTNTTASPVTGIVLYVNGSAASNQIVQMSLVANGSAVYKDGQWFTYDSTGSTLGGAGIVTSVTATDSSITVGGTSTAPTISRAALTGDVTASAGSNAITLATVNTVTPGTFGSATTTPVITVSGKGLTTASAQTTITPAVGSITGLATGISTFLATPTSANLATAVTDESGTGALTFANASVQKPKDIEGEVWIDTANTQGWSGADVGAWVNAAYAYLVANYYNSGTQVGGGVINIAPGAYTQTTAIVANTAGVSIIIRGAGDGWGATVITWSSAGVSMTLGGGGSNSGGMQLENITITGGGSINASGTGILLNGISGGTLKNVAVVRQATGINWNSANSAYGMVLLNVHVQFCTTGVLPLGENNVFVGGLIANNATGIDMNGASEAQVFGVAFDDNTTTAINVRNANARISLDGARFENAGAGTATYITQSLGSVSMVSGAFQSDSNSGTPSTGFVQQTGGVSKYDGVWHGLGGTQLFTQIYNPASPASITVVNPIVAPGSSATPLASLNWLPNTYDQALTAATATSSTTETIIKQRIVPLNTTDIGTSFRVSAYGTQVTATTSLIWKLHYGPLGTISDPIVFTTALVAVATTAGAGVQGLATIRSVGATGTIIGGASAQGTAPAGATTTATVLANSTQTNILTLTATTTAGTLTVQAAAIEQMQPN